MTLRTILEIIWFAVNLAGSVLTAVVLFNEWTRARLAYRTNPTPLRRIVIFQPVRTYIVRTILFLFFTVLGAYTLFFSSSTAQLTPGFVLFAALFIAQALMLLSATVLDLRDQTMLTRLAQEDRQATSKPNTSHEP